MKKSPEIPRARLAPPCTFEIHRLINDKLCQTLSLE